MDNKQLLTSNSSWCKKLDHSVDRVPNDLTRSTRWVSELADLLWPIGRRHAG